MIRIGPLPYTRLNDEYINDELREPQSLFYPLHLGFSLQFGGKCYFYTLKILFLHYNVT